jgi:hypothetical protein
LGGALESKNVCKICNSSMGKEFEGRLSNNFLFKVPRYIHNIKGKVGESTHPFAGNHKLNDGRLFRIHKNGKFEFQSSINVTPDTQNENSFNFQVDIDEDNVEHLDAFVLKKARRIANANGIEFTEHNLSKSVKEAICSSNLNLSVLKDPKIKVDASFDISDMKLLYIKIAYELACHQFGVKYIDDPVANNLRISLFNLEVHDDVAVRVLEQDDEALSTLFEDGYHWAHFHENVCYIRLYSLVGFVVFSLADADAYRTDNVYRFCYKTITWEVLNYQNMLMDLIMSGKLNDLIR